MLEVHTTDYHTAGEPFRIVTAGAPDIPGATVRDRREHARASAEVDRVRRLLCHEPRGHADMYGCFPVAPDDGGAADAGIRTLLIPMSAPGAPHGLGAVLDLV